MLYLVPIFFKLIDNCHRAQSSGSKNPLVLFQGVPEEQEYENAIEVSLLSMYQALYEPLQGREHKSSDDKIEKISFHVLGDTRGKDFNKISEILFTFEQGRRLTRDTGGSDPERMSPKNFAEYVKNVFASLAPNVKYTEFEGEVLEKEYPLLSSVSRGSHKRHSPVVVRLEYVGEGEIKDTILLAGKGVTYDTGGNNIKVGSNMAGMSRDKSGAASVAGFLLIAALLKPKNIKIVGELGLVRNACGSNAYVADEIITGHSGSRVKIINTDAEGRLVLADVLSHLREIAVESVNPRIFSIATLTGHCVSSWGTYTGTMDNGPALKLNVSKSLQEVGWKWGDGFEVSTVRRSDLVKTKPVDSSYDVLQHASGNRGHQFAAAFLAVASGLDKHGKSSDKPLPYTHLDIAGSACENGEYVFGKSTGSTVVALSAEYILPNL